MVGEMNKLNIKTIKNSISELTAFADKISTLDEKEQYPTKYPSVYIADAEKRNGEHVAYVGESYNVVQRTNQHLAEKRNEDALQKLNRLDKNGLANLHLIGHSHFNKSATLLIEQMLTNYIIGDPKFGHVRRDEAQRENDFESAGILNKRDDAQSDFYMRDEYENKIFPEIWDQLAKKNIVSKMSVVENSALFANSPFKQLSKEQLDAKHQIEDRIQTYMNSDSNETKIIKIEGLAGTGKTVLMSALFKDIYDFKDGDNEKKDSMSVALLVRHEQQLKVYEQLAKKLNMVDTVFEVPNFIAKGVKKDILLVDEAHLLWTGNYGRVNSNNWKPDLTALKDLAKIIVLIYDPMQEISGKSYLTPELKRDLDEAECFKLTNQWRINASEDIKNYIQNIIDFKKNSLISVPKSQEKQNYQLQFFDSAAEMYSEIEKKDQQFGLSRVVATFDWDFTSSKKPGDGDGIWYISAGDLTLPWNLQLPEVKKGQKKRIPWQAIPESINEVGSNYTIQGSDLNYVGVILGPSVEWDKENNCLKIEPKKSFATDATNVYKTVKNVDGLTFEEEQAYKISNLQNILNVLLTRGVHGLYIYAENDELREKLIQLNSK